MKKIGVLSGLVLCLFSVSVLLSGCATTVVTYGSIEGSDEFTDDFEDDSSEASTDSILNLPTHLYQKTEMRTSLSLRHDFNVQKPTQLELAVETLSGKLSIGVKNRDTGSYVLEMTECPTGEYKQTVSLEEAGQYSIVLELSQHTGSYEVNGKPAN